MKVASYLNLLENLIRDCSVKCSTKLYARDLITIKSRVEREGISFLTITLTNFGDSFFEAIEQNFVGSYSFPGWKKNKCLPAFLQGFTTQVFSKHTGRRLDDPNVQAIKSIRQICYFFKKINLPCSEKRTATAIKSYREIDRDLGNKVFDGIDFDLFTKTSRLVISTIFPSSVDEWDLLPHHGPGSTMEKLTGNCKYNPLNFKWYSQLDKCFSIGLNIYPNELSYFESRDDVEITLDKPFVRVVHVPKTLKTPRIIAMEPVVLQFLQQSIKDFIVKRVEASRLTKGHVNFTDQSINQQLALNSSKHCKLATLDLSSASDRVHNELVKKMFEVNPSLSELIQCTRSPIANVENEFISLNKFASMGSALCFPMEALVFYILLLVNRIKHKALLPKDVTLKSIIDLTKDIYVYGDDIIIPDDEVESAVTLFHNFGMKVSTTKSFYKSRFRESCGTDAYDGVDITPIYFRHEIPSRRCQARAIVSLVSTCNQLHCNGYIDTFNFLKKKIETILKRKLPTVTETCAGLGWINYNHNIPQARIRYNCDKQRHEVRTFVPSISFKKDEIDGIPALLKCLLRLEQRNSGINDITFDELDRQYREALIQDEKHLSRTPRRGSLTLKTRWVAR